MKTNTIDLSKLELKLKKLTTFYRNFTNSYSFKIDKENNKLFIYWNCEYNYKEIEIDWLDNISYDIWKNWIKSYYYKHIMDNPLYDRIEKQVKQKLEKYKSIRNYKTTFNLR